MKSVSAENRKRSSHFTCSTKNGFKGNIESLRSQYMIFDSNGVKDTSPEQENPKMVLQPARVDREQLRVFPTKEMPNSHYK